MKKADLVYLTKVYFGWKILIFLSIFLAPRFLVLNNNFLGGGITEYIKNPFFWSTANFDGEHYLAIALRGYQPLTYFYFPVYPSLIRHVSEFFGVGILGYALVGQLLSNLFIFIGILGLYKLIRLDYKQNIARNSVLLMLVFPSSFYFGAVYTESLFLCLAVWSFYYARRQEWLAAGFLGMIASATKVVGIVLFFALGVEFIRQYSKNKTKNIYNGYYLLLIPLGLIIYMYYLWDKTGDPLEFMNSVGIFGDQRSSTWIMFPQVLYRYLFKILPNYNWNYLPGSFSLLMEFGLSMIFAVLAVVSIYKMRLSYSAYFLIAYIIPTLAGSFSSMGRYVLVLFPAYILMAKYFEYRQKAQRIFIFVSAILMILSSMLFVRGYWYA